MLDLQPTTELKLSDYLPTKKRASENETPQLQPGKGERVLLSLVSAFLSSQSRKTTGQQPL